MTKRYTDEQLSRILSEHAACHLQRFGHGWYPGQDNRRCCVNQAAYNLDDEEEAGKMKHEATTLFDCHYRPTFTPEQLLRLLSAL